jgi:hypothetical protein
MATRIAPGRTNLHLHGAEKAEVALAGRNVAAQHYPALARGLAATGDYDAVFYGHNHDQHEQRLTVGEGEVLLANPGTLAAMGKAQTFRIYDTEANEARLFEVDRL